MALNILAILVIILKSPYYILRYALKHKGLALGCVILIVGIIIISNVRGGTDKNANSTPIPAYQIIAPAVNLAPSVGTTSSRVYYIASYQKTPGIVTLTKFYDYNKKAWKLNTMPLSFNESEITIIPR